MPSTMMSRSGSSPVGRGSSGDMRCGSELEAKTEGALSAAGRGLEGPGVHNCCSQRNAAIAPFRKGIVDVSAPVPHQRIRKTNSRCNLFDYQLIGYAQEGRIALDTGFAFANCENGG